MRIEKIRRVACIVAVAACALAASSAGAQALYEAFVLAVTNDRVDEVRSLLARGIDPNTVDPDGNPALLIATRNASLADNPANPGAGAGRNSMAPSAGVGSPGASLDMIDLLLKAGAKVDARNRFGDSSIMVAALGGNLVLVKKFYAVGATINNPGWTPLIYAATNGHTEVMRYLLEVGADINAEAPNGTTALMMAVRSGKLDSVELLLAKGADANHRNQQGATALNWAQRGQLEAIEKALRKSGAKS